MTHIKYDSAVLGNLTSSFTRDLATRDLRGVDVAINERRYAPQVSIAPEVNWTESGVIVGAGGAPAILASGYDKDGITPLLLVNDTNSQNMRLYRGYDLTLQNTIPYTGVNQDIMQGAVAGKSYTPSPGAAVIYHGFIAFLCLRKEPAGGNTIGISVVFTQDYGTTLDRVTVSAIDGSGKDIPALAGSVLPITANLVRHWCFQNAWPTSRTDNLGAFLCGSDYVAKTSNPGGGQVFLFRITRALIADTFTIEPIRLVYSNWDALTTSRHIHGGAVGVDDDCVDCHIGDTGANSQIIRIGIDLANYDTDATLVETEIHGGLDVAAAEFVMSPQPVSLCPGPTNSKYLGAADVSPEKVHNFEITGATTVEISTLLGGYSRSHGGWDALNLHHLPGTGYAYGGFASTTGLPACAVSRDGINFAEINVPLLTDYAWLLGDRLAWLDRVSRKIHTALFPVIDAVSPLAISPGGSNIADTAWALDQAPLDAGNTVDYITYNGTNFLDSGASPLPTQPPPPPFVNAALIIRLQSNGTPAGGNFGRQWITSAVVDLDVSVNNMLVVWVCNLSKAQSLQLSHKFGVGGAGGAIAEVFERDHSYLTWHPRVLYGEPTVDIPARGRYWMYAPISAGQKTPDCDFLVAIDYLGPVNGTPYSIAPAATGAHEKEVVTGFTSGASWTAGIVFQWPDNAAALDVGSYTICTLYESATDYVEIRVNHTGDLTGNIIADFVVASASVGTVTVPCDAQPGQVVDVVVANSGAAQTVVCRNRGIASATMTGILAATIVPVAVRWSNADQSVVHSVNPVLAQIDQNKAWTQADAEAWMAESLYARTTDAGRRARQQRLVSPAA